MNQLQKELEFDLECCIKDFEDTGALPSPIMEEPYSMLLSMYRDKPSRDENNNEQRYMSFMVLNYYGVKYRGYY